MATNNKTDQILWMADCYSLAKRFPNPHTWLCLLAPKKIEGTQEYETLSPYDYWLWMEIWKAAQSDTAPQAVASGNS